VPCFSVLLTATGYLQANNTPMAGQTAASWHSHPLERGELKQATLDCAIPYVYQILCMHTRQMYSPTTSNSQQHWSVPPWWATPAAAP
jgi:hypothetical protein